ncbi:MAG: TonB-dependent receptor [bacterium]
MLHARVCAILGIGLMLTPATTGARELELAIGQRIGADSNVFRQQDDEREDGFYEFAPSLVVREARTDDLIYSLRYGPRYRAFFDTDGIDGWDHGQSARLQWQATPRDQLSLDQSFSSTRTRRLEAGFGDSALEASDRDRVQRTRLNAGYSHAFTPRWSGRLGLEFEDLDFDAAGNVDNRAYGGSVGANYAVFETTSVGLSASGRFRESRGLESRNELSSENVSGSIAASFSHAFSPSLDLSFQIGPSIIRSEPDAETVDATTDVSFFATAAMEKRWRQASFSISYTRSESGGAGAVTSQILDAVDVSLAYDPRPDWHFDLLGRWNRRETLSDLNLGGLPFNVGTQQDSQIFQVFLRGSHRLTKRISLRGELSYQNQETEQSFSISSAESSRTIETFAGFLSLRYLFDPWIF